jgi:hypothetical protein
MNSYTVRCVLLLVSLPFVLLAQTRGGELRLTVTDPSGAAVAASAEITGEATAVRQTVALPPDGKYLFKNLPFGTYRLLITHEGFSPVSDLIEIRSELPVIRAVKLGVSSLNTLVEVTASETLVDTDRTAAAYYVGAEQIKERPVGFAGRGLVDLVLMQPGWSAEANGVLHPRESEYETQYIVDGFPVQDNRSPAYAPDIGADNVQAIKVYTSGIPAEYGQKVGGVIEVTTDQNASPGFHGTAVVQGGSFDTAGGYLSSQYIAKKTSVSLSTEGFLTDRYLDPPVLANYTNHASNSSFTGTLERDFTEKDRVRVSASHRRTGFLVPDELIQQAAGQREDRAGQESEGRISLQHIFSPSLLGSIRGMVRDVSASLWSNPLAIPIAPEQDRGFREGYANGSLAGHYGRHEWKTGAEARYTSINEEFGYQIVAYRVLGTRIFDSDTPPQLNFRGHAPDREQSAYVQDTVHLGRFTLNAGLRFDHYSLLVDQTAFSPRLGLSWNLPSTGTVLHVSYDRTFGTPPIENILVSASASVLTLNDNAFYLPLQPSRGNYYEAGFTQAIAKRVRLDASYFRRDIRNLQDDDLLLNTGVSFPIAFHRAEVRGIETKLEVPRWGAFSGFLSYSNSIGVAQFPIAGGLFLDDNAAQLLASNDHFPISQDQRNTARALARYQIAKRVWTSWSANWNSGLPAEIEQPYSFLISQYGAAIVQKVNFERNRVNPSFSLDASIGADLWRHEKRSVSMQANVLNLTDRLNVINFAGLFSGTAIAPPRSFGLRLRMDW